MTLQIQIASDLHIEYYKEDDIDISKFIKPSAPILILAGDIGNLYRKTQLENFLKNVCKEFKAVIYVPGNHEYYKRSDHQPIPFYKLNFILTDIERLIENLYILRQDCIQINDTYFVGCTLWSKYQLPILPKFIVRIKGFNKDFYNNLYYRDVTYIKKMMHYCKKNDGKLVVITHHVPTYNIDYKQKKLDKYKSLYFSNLDYLMKSENMSTWICGHIHYNFDKMTFGGVRLVSNQKGKPKDNIQDYSSEFVINV
tara:strand:- start:1988 stop:2749 length:762 start_codon:yes stop_codon:yes gene_type:complete